MVVDTYSKTDARKYISVASEGRKQISAGLLATYDCPCLINNHSNINASGQMLKQMRVTT